MKALKKYLMLWSCVLVAVVFTTDVLSAQSQPDYTYTWTSLNAGVTSTPFLHNIDDFIFSFLNEFGGQIDIVATLTSTSGNAWGKCGVNGSTFTYDTTTLNDQSTYAWNVINQSVRVDSHANYFSGSLTATEAHNYDFYSGEPTNYPATTGTYLSTKCSAYYTAWENGVWEPEWFWDGTVQRLVSPYANEWHNENFWDIGWNTDLEITNNGAHANTYSIVYIGDAIPGPRQPFEKDPGNCSSINTLNGGSGAPASSGSISGSGGHFATDLDSMFGTTGGWDVYEDGAFEITLSIVEAGTGPYSIIQAGSGTAGSCGAGCSNTGSARGTPLLTSCWN